jgi:thiol-disulfide isomerase/thioredoxin
MHFLRKNGFFIVLMIALIIVQINPGAKQWLLRQLLHTGIYNAHIDKPVSGHPINFHYQDEQNNVHQIAHLKGKVVLINFWASWCPPCRAELPSLQNLYNGYGRDHRIAFVTINEDSELSAAKNYLKKNSFSLPLLKSPSGIADSLYSGTLPTTIILDKAGRVRYRHEGMANFAADDFMKQLKELTQE